MLRAFLFDDCKVSGTWTMKGFIEEAEEAIRQQVGEHGRVICGLSGGVDSSVAALLLHRAIGARLQCIFVDNGLLRQGEREQVEALFVDRFHVPLKTVDARERFLEKLAGVTDPEKKRKIIGREFIAVFEEAAREVQDARVPGPGHAVPGRDRVRVVQGPVGDHQEPPQRGRAAGGDEAQAGRAAARAVQGRGARAGPRAGAAGRDGCRQPFPGPGLAIRVLGEVTEERLELRAAGRTRSSWRRSARRGCTARCGRRSRCCCRCRAWA